jgi:hypothetical protein
LAPVAQPSGGAPAGDGPRQGAAATSYRRLNGRRGH